MFLNIADNLAAIKKEIRQYEERYQRIPGSVFLLAVSKGRSAAQIKLAYESGQRHFGENYVQESILKQVDCREDIVWHYIGKIQSNKTNKIANHFSWVHCVENEKMARRLNEQRLTSLGQLNICIAVNIDQSATKLGVSSGKVQELARFCNQLHNLKLRGLMVFPDWHESFSEQRAIFHKAWVLFSGLCEQGLILDTLSMGTSHDFEAAIAEGATIVRIGNRIFESSPDF